MELHIPLLSPPPEPDAGWPAHKKGCSGSPLKLKKLTPMHDQPPGDDGGKEKEYLKFLERQGLWDFLTKKGKQRIHLHQEVLPPHQPPLKLIHPLIHSTNIY